MINLPKKTIVYIDGFNLYYSLKRRFQGQYKWLNLEKLIQIILPPSEYEILKIIFFTAKVKQSKTDKTKDRRQEIYLKALNSLSKMQIIHGKFKHRINSGINIQTKQFEKFEKWEEKETDVNIASEIIYDCCKESDLAVIALLSNDSDLKKPLQIAKERFNKKIILISPAEKVQRDLAKYSTFVQRIKEADIKNSQFSNTVSEKPLIRKPDSWK